MNYPTRFRYFEAAVYPGLNQKFDFLKLDDTELTHLMEECQFIRQDELETVLRTLAIKDRNRAIFLADFYGYLERASHRHPPHWVISIKTTSVLTAAVLKRALSNQIRALMKMPHFVSVKVDEEMLSDDERFQIKYRGRFHWKNPSWSPGEFNRNTVILGQAFKDPGTVALLLENPKIQNKLEQYLREPNTLMHRRIQDQINEKQIWDAPV